MILGGPGFSDRWLSESSAPKMTYSGCCREEECDMSKVQRKYTQRSRPRWLATRYEVHPWTGPGVEEGPLARSGGHLQLEPGGQKGETALNARLSQQIGQLKIGASFGIPS